MIYDTKEMLEYYDKKLAEAVSSTRDLKGNWSTVKKIAIMAVKEKYPDHQFIHQRVSDSADASDFYHSIQNIQKKYKPKSSKVKQIELHPEQIEIFRKKSKPFMVILRNIANSGFVPYFETLSTIMNGDCPTRDLLTNSISDLRDEGYICKRSDYGYIITPPVRETPEQKAAREAEEARIAEKAEIKKQLELLAERLAKLG